MRYVQEKEYTNFLFIYSCQESGEMHIHLLTLPDIRSVLVKDEKGNIIISYARLEKQTRGLGWQNTQILVSCHIHKTAAQDYDNDRISEQEQEEEEIPSVENKSYGTRGKEYIEEGLLLQRKHHVFNKLKAPKLTANNMSRKQMHRSNTQSRQLYGTPVKRMK